jgi:hypothetical protein
MAILVAKVYIRKIRKKNLTGNGTIQKRLKEGRNRLSVGNKYVISKMFYKLFLG